MNDKFLKLPYEKQQRILNAGYKIFSVYSYKKASTNHIADEAGISKSLLFHYFRNKQTYYDYLFQSAIQLIQEQKKSKIANGADFFELIEKEIHERLQLMKTSGLQYRFILKAYEENHRLNNNEMSQYIENASRLKRREILENIDRSLFRDEEDIPVLYDMIIDLSNGFYFRVYEQGELKDPNGIEAYLLFLNNLKKNYYKGEQNG
ncbi:MAG: TetR/AcrR family transcriptional regulator [Clostridiales bacterium]|nr:TetR/AcrR family transcriptional regulator [Clostridiales bacterium]